MNTAQKADTYLANTYAHFPLTIAHGAGALLYDEDEREYIDLATGIAVNTFGAADPEWQAAVTAQLSQIQHTSNLFYSKPCADLAELLCQKSGMEKVFFSNSGAEANECAIKAARKYGAIHKGKECYNIITLKNSFHGRTITTLAATGQDSFHQDFTPLTTGFLYAEAGDTDAIRTMMQTGTVAAVMFEPVQGEAGVLELDATFVLELAEMAKKYDVLLVVDEVQTGNGRTGQLYGYMNYGILPDIVTTAKGLGGGLPIGATLLGKKVADVYTPGTHGSTFGGNPIVCAGACSILSRIDDALLQGVRKRAAYIRTALANVPGIVSVTGMGLMLGIETVRDAADVIRDCRENGVIVIKAKNKIRLLPPLNIPMTLLEKAIGILREACTTA